MIKHIKNRKLRIRKGHSKGFTLIELLTVIAIIGILTGLLSVSFLGVRARGRDVQRKGDIKSIQSALELYRSDNDFYPTSSPITPCGPTATPWSSGTSTTVYLQKIPCDPSTNAAYYYYSYNNGTSYILTSCLENKNDKDGTASTNLPNWVTQSGASLPSCSSNHYYIANNP